MKKLLRNNSNTIAYCVLFGIALSIFMGPIGAGVGIVIGSAVGQHEDKKNGENK